MFFLFVVLKLERELWIGELSTVENALYPFHHRRSQERGA